MFVIYCTQICAVSVCKAITASLNHAVCLWQSSKVVVLHG